MYDFDWSWEHKLQLKFPLHHRSSTSLRQSKSLVGFRQAYNKFLWRLTKIKSALVLSTYNKKAGLTESPVLNVVGVFQYTYQ